MGESISHDTFPIFSITGAQTNPDISKFARYKQLPTTLRIKSRSGYSKARQKSPKMRFKMRQPSLVSHA